MENQTLQAIANEFGTPAYVYDLSAIRRRIETLRAIFDNAFDISYAVKSNPNRALITGIADLVGHLDISSGGELLLARQAGFDPARMTFVGPAKAEWELRLALEAGCGWIVAESTRELEMLAELAAQGSHRPAVLLRVNPSRLPKGYGVSMSSRPTQFGIDEEELDPAIEKALSLGALRLEGFHIYAGTQCLKNDAIVENFENCARIFREAAERHGLRPKLLIFGSGFGIPYHPGNESIDLDDIARRSAPALQALRDDPATSDASCSLELGRYLVGEFGWYLVRVLGHKATRGKEILLLDGGMNHHLAASGNLGGVLKRNYPIRRVNPAPDDAPARKYELAGNLCTNIDSLGHDVELPETGPGDILAVACSGAYGISSSPLHFISHRPPREILVTDEAAPRDITEQGTVANPPPWQEIPSPPD